MLTVSLKRLRDWFNNHKWDLAPTRVKKVLDFRARKKRHLSGCEAYYHLYWDVVLRHIVQKRWVESPNYDPEKSEAPFEFRTTLVQELWRLEKKKSPIKEEVAAYIEAEYQRMNGKDVDDEEDAIPNEEDEGVDPEEVKRRQANRKLQE